MPQALKRGLGGDPPSRLHRRKTLMAMDRAQKLKERDQWNDFDEGNRGPLLVGNELVGKVLKEVRGYYEDLEKELAATTKSMQSICQSQSLGNSF